MTMLQTAAPDKSNNISLVIADDHPVFREGLRRVIESEPTFRIEGEACHGKEALRLIESLRPKVALLDGVMPELNGLGVAREIKKRALPVAVVFLTMFKEEDMFNEAMDLGARGYLLKDNAVVDILSCLRAVARGEYFISPALSHLLLQRTERARGLAAKTPGMQDLTPSERRILGLVSRGKTSKEIAAELSISPKTVENHRLNIAVKLKLHGNHALLKFALEHRDAL